MAEIRLRPRPLIQRLAYAGLEVAWAYPWLVLLTRTLDAPVSRWGPLAFLGLCLLSALASSYATVRLPLGQARLVLTLSALVAAALFSRGEGTGFLAALYFWWRGYDVAGAGVGLEEAVLRFRWSILALVLALLATVIFGPPLAATPYVLSIFFLGLVAVALGRMASSGAAGLSPSSAARWLGIFAASVGGVVLLAWAGLAFLQSRLFQALWAPIGRALDRLLWTLLLAFAYLMAPVLNFLLALLGGWADRLGERNPFDALEELRRNLEAAAPQGEPADSPILGILRWVLILLALLGLALVLAYSIGHRPSARGPGDEGEREALTEERPGLGNLLAGQIGHWLEEGLDALRGRLGGEPGPLTVRRIYRDLLRRAAQRGHARRPPVTPLEFQQEMEAAFPGHEPEVWALTRAYLLVRYGDQLPDRAGLEGLVAAYERIVGDGGAPGHERSG